VPEQKIKLNRIGNTVADAFGVNNERKSEILKKLIAVANIYRTYSIIAESFFNCEDRFTEKERLYGLFLLGKVYGCATMLKFKKQTIKTKEFNMDLELKLMALLCKEVIVEKVLMEALRQ